MDIEAELARLKSLFDKRLIDEAEYREEKKALLSSSRPSGSTPPALSGSPQGTAISLVAGMTIGPDNKRLFRLEKKLGGGAMGEVWKAEDEAESKIVGHTVWVAVKALIPFLSAGERHREALKREAINAKKLSHAHIIRTHDWYEDKVGGFPFLVMEYLEGQTLDQKLAQAGHFTYAETLDILKPIVEALTYAWEEHHIVHRDLKPDNIYLTAEGKLKLLDFGIAAQVRNTASAVGLSGFDSPGTLGYAPPEAGANRKADPRSDIYSLGILSYELLEGQLPFNGLRQPTTPLPEKPEELNEAQWQVLHKAIAYEVQERYDSAGAFLGDLKKATEPSEDVIVAVPLSVRVKGEGTKGLESIVVDQSVHVFGASGAQITHNGIGIDNSVRHTEQSKKRAVPVRASLAVGVVILVVIAANFGGKKEPASTLEPAVEPIASLSPVLTAVASTATAPAQTLAPGPSVAAVVAVPPAPSSRAGQVIKDCAECPEMVAIPAGSFEMGSNTYSGLMPVHTVTIKAFAMGKTEVTAEQYLKCVEDGFCSEPEWREVGNPYHYLTGKYAFYKSFASALTDPGFPIVGVSWEDGMRYAQWLSKKAGKVYRLPSEAEWEYACRSGADHRYCGGDDVDLVAWWGSKGGDIPHSVARKRANAFGLFDMSGNAWEWVADSAHNDYVGAPSDGSVWYRENGKKVLRGGFFAGSEGYAESTYRDWENSKYRAIFTGFRIARESP